MAEVPAALEFIKVVYDEAAMIVSLERPGKCNALSAAFIEEIYDSFEYIRRRETVCAVVARAAGEHYCAGLDPPPPALYFRCDTALRQAGGRRAQRCGGLEFAFAFHIRPTRCTNDGFRKHEQQG